MAKNLTDILVGVSSGVLKVTNGGTGVGTLTGILKGNGTSALTAATVGTDYVAPGTATTFTTLQTFNLIRTVNTHETFQTLTHSASGTLAINFTNGNVIYLNQGANITGFTLSGITSGASFSFNIIRKNTAGSALSITWGTTFKWSNNGVLPTLTNTANAIDIFTFITVDGGTTIYGVSAGTNFA